MAIHPLAYVLSDSVGETAELVVKARLSECNNGDLTIKRMLHVKNKATIYRALQKAKKNKAIIGFTLVDPLLRNYLNTKAMEMSIPVIDIMGPVMNVMERVFDKVPHLEPGLVHQLDEDYFKRVEAIEFVIVRAHV